MRAHETSQLPGYAIAGQIYEGSRSTVYRAVRVDDGQPVILKVANTDRVALDEAHARLTHELESIQAIASDRVIRAYGVATFPDQVALVLQDIGGESIATWLGRGRLGLAHALAIAIGAAEALREVHAAGIIHRDVTPNNIVFNAATGEVQLIDFDIATAWRTDHRGFVPPGTLEGTLLYMAPEQTGRMNRATDRRADLYALGATLFEMLAGRPPFVESDLLSIVHAHLAVRPPPPETLVPGLPAPVSAIVMKLLAKAPEDRYQTAHGVLADLRACAGALAQTGAIPELALGRDDTADELALPTRLYGRTAEHQILAAAFDRVWGGAVEVVLVGGPSGVGKTSVVNELFPLVTQGRGYFLSGKFEQLRGDAPYPALVAAFDELTHHLLTEGDDELARWRDQITRAIAPNGQIVVDAVPALGRVLGPQPAVVALDAGGTQSRFHHTLLRLIQVLAQPSHPLVVFLDDTQWADPETIQLLKLVAGADATRSLLVIQAYRDNETSDGHPMMVAARELERAVRVTRLVIAPLPPGEIAKLVADTLHREIAEVEPLARLVCRKTDGNPFFVRQLLLALHAGGHIAFDPVRRHFTFDAPSIERAPISENVADLLADQLRKLPATTQRVLALAAALGSRFELELLAPIAGLVPAALHAELTAAIDQELVVPLSDLEYVASPAGSGLVTRRLRFQHDRVQRAAYGLMSPDDQQRTHLRIGELIGGDASAHELGDRLFDVVSQLGRAAALISAPDRVARLAQLNVAAARKARGSAAYASAVECLRVAIDRLAWTTDYEARFEAQLMLAECLYLGYHPARGLEVLDAAVDHMRYARDLATLEALRARIHLHASDFTQAIAATRRAALLLGRPLPHDAAVLADAVPAMIREILHQLGDREVEQLLELPAMTDLDALALTSVLRSCFAAAFNVEPLLTGYITAQIVLVSLEHGNCAASAYAYALFGRVLHGGPLHALSYRFCELGVTLNRRLDDRASRPMVDLVFGVCALAWHRPVEQAIARIRAAVPVAYEVGDYFHGGILAQIELWLRLFHGAEPLAQICHDGQIYRQQCRDAGTAVLAAQIDCQIDRARVLMGELESLATEPGPPQRTLEVPGAGPVTRFYLLMALVDTLYATGDDEAALDLALGNRELEVPLRGVIALLEHRFFVCLAAAAVAARRPARRAELEALLDADQRALARWVGECAANLEPLYLIVEAERAGLADADDAPDRYELAIASAGRYGRRRFEALASELYGRYWLAKHQLDLARPRLARARHVYAGLGAHRKVRAIERQHTGLARAGVHGQLTVATSASAASEVLDVTAIAKATRAISSELELDKLLERMLDIIFENAGAEGGALVRATPNGLRIAAYRTAGATQTSTDEVALDGALLPRSLILYVLRTETAVVLDAALADGRFGNDDYIRARRSQSVLCMPVRHKDRMLGVLYLENALVSGAFTKARLEALSILVSQIAVSLENATLFAAQRVQAEAISRANAELRGEIAVRKAAERELALHRAQLEELVAARTQELTLANQKLRSAAAERERIEGELRLAQKLESVGRLAAGIAHEINTPVQFVSDNLTFMREALPGLGETIRRYRALAVTVDRLADPDATTAAAAAREAELAGDVDYTLANTPGALDTALDGLRRVAAIVRSMKDFAYPDRDEKTPVDLNRAIESTLMIAAHECKYVADVETDLAPLPPVSCHAGEINQAVLNLVINAAHAIRDLVGSSGLKGKIGVRTRRLADAVEIAVSDTGCGIPERIRDKIYDPFFTTKEVGHGTGQGLAIVRNVVVDKHGGSLRFETAVGVGTTFFLQLPLTAAHASLASA